MSTLASKQREIDRAWQQHTGDRVPTSIWRQLRTFKRNIAPVAANIQRALDDKATMQRMMTDFAFKKKVGRARAISRLKEHLAGATLQFENDAVIATWLEPTGPLHDSDDPSLQQDSVVVLVGLGGKRAAHTAGFLQFLSVDVPDHALARLLQRSPNADLAEALHEACVRYNSADAHEMLACVKEDREFYLPGGDGLFLCKAVKSKDGRAYPHARCRTWISNDMARADQKPLAMAGDNADPMLCVLMAMAMGELEQEVA